MLKCYIDIILSESPLFKNSLWSVTVLINLEGVKWTQELLFHSKESAKKVKVGNYYYLNELNTIIE